MKKANKRRSYEEKPQTFRSSMSGLEAIPSIPLEGDNQIYYKNKLYACNYTI